VFAVLQGIVDDDTLVRRALQQDIIPVGRKAGVSVNMEDGVGRTPLCGRNCRIGIPRCIDDVWPAGRSCATPSATN
jgi:hypothetical protein